MRTSIKYHAYAPEPMVLDTSLNGTCVGSGASCECGNVGVIALSHFTNAFFRSGKAGEARRRIDALLLDFS